MFRLVVLGLRKTNEHRRKHCKYKCLYKGNKQLQHIHENGEEDRHHRHCAANLHVHRHCNKYY